MKRFIIATIFGTIVVGSVFGMQQTQRTQKARIKQGVASGELTQKEAAKLRAEQQGIRLEKRAAAADGVVTPEEKAAINQDKKRASKHIYNQKHDAQVKP